MDWGVLGQAATSFLVDYFAVAVGALTGALFAVEHKLDIVGTVALGLVAGYGGGIIRDTLLHDQGFFFMEHADCVVICIALCALVSLSRKRVRALGKGLFHVDAFSMALFALAGTSKAWSAGVGFVLAVVLGTLTAVGGGVLRDICVGEMPTVFQAGNFYALSGLAGSIAYVALAASGLPLQVADVACVAVAFALTVLSARFNWRTRAGAG